jgi:hypothetical protein
MPKTIEEIMETVRRLLALSKSDNIGEAASALSKAQALIDRHKLDRALIEADLYQQGKGSTAPKRSAFLKTVFVFSGVRVISWIASLAHVIAEHNSCQVISYLPGIVSNTYQATATLQLIGDEEDFLTVGYLLNYVVKEIERLTEIEFKVNPLASGKTHGNNFKMGAVLAVQDSLKLLRKAEEERAKNPQKALEADYKAALAAGDSEAVLRLDSESKQYSLATYNQALVLLDARKKEIDSWVEANLKTHKRPNTFRRKDDAYERGYKAGSKIDVGLNKRRLT